MKEQPHLDRTLPYPDSGTNRAEEVSASKHQNPDRGHLCSDLIIYLVRE